MKTLTVKILLISLTTIVGIFFVILTTVYPQYGVMLLSIELLLLPAMYMVGNEANESILREDFKDQTNLIKEGALEMEEELQKLSIENEILKKERTIYFPYGSKKENAKKQNRKRK